ncbi:MAG: hypothetical protein K6E56_07025 [Lachnospiraceae bacterium]|nr:hypothetical protein [Lachnospiraceae bacterium]
MSSQDHLERALRDIHVLISKSESYGGNKVIIDKNELFALIDRLNKSIYKIMEDYELTKASRDAAEREHRKKADKIVWDASRKAEDIYAASIMYTDETLGHIEEIIRDAGQRIEALGKSMVKDMEEQRITVKENQLELKGQMQDLLDTEKYLSLIEERNKEIEKQKLLSASRYAVSGGEKSQFADVKAEIKINKEYFKNAGIPIEDDEEEEESKKDEKETKENHEKKSAVKGLIKRIREDIPTHEEAEDEPEDDESPKIPSEELDAEYFAWKDEK